LNKLLLKLKDNIKPIDYDRYFNQLTIDSSSSNNNIILVFPNILIANWIKTKYLDKIKILTKEIYGNSSQITIRVKEKDLIILDKKQQNKTTKKKTLLNPSYEFDNFVVGGSNQFAFTASKSAAEKPGLAYNPLFLYGGVGLGKTHLLQAIGNYCADTDKNIIYVTSEELMNDFTFNINNKTMLKFREKYRKCDILLIDDIQFLGGKDLLQEEFFHTFNELHSQNKQLVITADKPPKKIIGVEERLISRFEWGLSTNIQPPELETKIAIIKKKCELDGIKVNNNIINYIATNLHTNIREIEGILIKINAYANMINQDISLELTINILKEHIEEKKEEITINDIIKIISKELNIKPSEIKSKSKQKDITNARRIVIYLARSLTHNSMPTLAQYFNMKDHSSVSHAMKKVSVTINDDEEYKVLIDELKNKILSNK
jgi:chromosomal replication initiator protein